MQGFWVLGFFLFFFALIYQLNKKKMNIRFTGPTSLNNILNSIQIDDEFCKMTGAKMFIFLHPCDLE